MNRQPAQFVFPKVSFFTKVVLILSVVIFLIQLAGEQFLGFSLSSVLGFVPGRILEGWIWQPFTYTFLHAGLFHLLFNLLILWSVGSELEQIWGSPTYIGFFFCCAMGAAIFHGAFSLLGIGPGPMAPVIGSSGVVYGLLLAYGILFGDRLMYFFLLFPMPAKYFVMILGAVELVSSVFYSRDGISHLAHLGGMAFGFLYMISLASWRRRVKAEASGFWEARARQKRRKNASHLRLVPDQDDDDETPKQWN